MHPGVTPVATALLSEGHVGQQHVARTQNTRAQNQACAASSQEEARARTVDVRDRPFARRLLEAEWGDGVSKEAC